MKTDDECLRNRQNSNRTQAQTNITYAQDVIRTVLKKVQKFFCFLPTAKCCTIVSYSPLTARLSSRHRLSVFH